MPSRAPGDAPAGTIRALGLPGRAVTALTRAGITGVEDLAGLSRRELAAIPGLGAGMIAAIRRVVPEPPVGNAPSPVPPAAEPAADGAEEESPAAPPIPSFDSLRGPRRRTAVDLLVPGRQPEPSDGAPARPAGPRPAEYADLWRFGVRVARALAAAPLRMVCWSVRQPVRCLRRSARG